MSLPINEELLLRVANVLAGEDAVKIVKALRGLSKATDDELSSKTDVRLNTVRKILYRLQDFSLVTVDRLRDEKTGWFIFYWRLQSDQIEGFIQNQKRKILEKLVARLDYEQAHDFYHCPTPSCNRVIFEEAVELAFHCQTCGKPLRHIDNDQVVKVLVDEIETIQRELSE